MIIFLFSFSKIFFIILLGLMVILYYLKVKQDIIIRNKKLLQKYKINDKNIKQNLNKLKK